MHDVVALGVARAGQSAPVVAHVEFGMSIRYVCPAEFLLKGTILFAAHVLGKITARQGVTYALTVRVLKGATEIVIPRCRIALASDNDLSSCIGDIVDLDDFSRVFLVYEIRYWVGPIAQVG